MKIRVLHDYGGVVVDNLFFGVGEYDVEPALALRMIEHGIAEAIIDEAAPEVAPEPAPDEKPAKVKKVKR